MILYILPTLFTFTTFVSIVSSNSALCGDWTQYKDEKCLKVLYDKLLSFDNAVTECSQLEGSALLTVKSKEEQEFLSELFFKRENIVDSVWIGLRMDQNVFKWVYDNSNASYTNWENGSPYHNAAYSCAEIESKTSKWVDESCNKKNLVVCQKAPSIELSALQMAFIEMRRELNDNKVLLNNTINELNANTKALTEKNSQLQKELTETNVKLNENSNQLNNTIKDLTETKHTLTETKTQLSNSNTKLSNTINELTETKAQLNSTVKDLSETKIHLNQELAENKKELTETKAKLSTVANLLIKFKFNYSKAFTDDDGKQKVFMIPDENGDYNELKPNEAAAVCANYNSNLVEIRSQEKQTIFDTFMKDIGLPLNNPHGLKLFWINVQRDSTGIFKWAKSNAELTFTNWHSGQPDNSAGHDYVWADVESVEFGKWATTDINEEAFVVCEMELNV